MTSAEITHAEKAEAAARSRRYMYILPVLFFEYLALALARSLLPSLLVDYFGGWTYRIIGISETIKGLLAFAACPMFGQLSDIIGRRRCLLLTVVGTTLPVCVLAVSSSLPTHIMFQALSGIFAATFPLTFAYIADIVPKEGRASAYGLALATFGLSFSLGPMAGGYLSRALGYRAVFISSFVLVCIDVAYIVLILPESLPSLEPGARKVSRTMSSDRGVGVSLPIPIALLQHGSSEHEFADDSTLYLPLQWNPLTSLFAFSGSPLLRRVAVVVFLYYTGVWALVSTLMVYVTRRFEFSAVEVGHLLSAFGVCTMFAEGVLVRILVPWLGEKLVIQLGLLGFAVQCFMIGLAASPWMIFLSMGGSIFSNLVYPAISSLVSKSVASSAQGEVLGTMNGVRALTEGFGPLTFGFLMGQFEGGIMPGAPYLISGVIAVFALVYSFGIPNDSSASDISAVGAFGKDIHGHDPLELQPLLSSGNKNSNIIEEDSDE